MYVHVEHTSSKFYPRYFWHHELDYAFVAFRPSCSHLVVQLHILHVARINIRIVYTLRTYNNKELCRTHMNSAIKHYMNRNGI